MQVVSTNPNEFGIISIGQEAWGFIAIGQMARGVFVLGQLAVGVAGAGQLCACVWGVGQVGFGLGWFTAMVGLGGRGYGGVLRLIPGLDPPRIAPPEVQLGDVVSGATTGYVKLDVTSDALGPALGQGGQVLPIKLTPAVAAALEQHGAKLPQVFARVRRHGPTVLCDQLVEIPGARSTIQSRGLLFVRVGMMLVLGTVWWALFVELVLP